MDFAYQFLVNNGQMPVLAVKAFPIFRKVYPENSTEIKIIYDKEEPLYYYDSIVDSYILPVSSLIENLINLCKNDSKVKKFSIMMLEKLLFSIKKVNRVKIERCMIIIKSGISSNCNFDTIKALVDLENLIYILYPPDRKFFSEGDVIIFSENVYGIICNGTIEKLIDKINLEETITNKTRELLLNVVINERSQLPKLLGSYLGKIEISETSINSTLSISETIDLINKRLHELKFKQIEISTFCISTMIKESVIYIEYFGFVNKPIGGKFALDFYTLNRILKPNSYTYFIFYFVTCHYCLTNDDNILDIKFKTEIKKPGSNVMFKFLDDMLLNKMKESINSIPEQISYKGIFRCLKLFFETML